MVSKRLYAFREIREMVGIIILVLSFAVSCTDSKSIRKAVEVINQDENESEDESVSDGNRQFNPP